MNGKFLMKATHLPDPSQCAHFDADEICKRQPKGSYFISECPPGDFGFNYICPRCGVRDFMGVKGGNWDSGWVWDGNRNSPTLSPSILHHVCGWHGYLENGQWRQV